MRAIIAVLFAAITTLGAAPANTAPYTLTEEGIAFSSPILPHGHVNVRTTDSGTKNLHFEPKQGSQGKPWIGKKFLPWSALGITNDCIEWVQWSETNYHFGENGESKFCIGTEDPEPTPDPTTTTDPTTPPVETPDIVPVDVVDPTITTPECGIETITLPENTEHLRYEIVWDRSQDDSDPTAGNVVVTVTTDGYEIGNIGQAWSDVTETTAEWRFTLDTVICTTPTEDPTEDPTTPPVTTEPTEDPTTTEPPVTPVPTVDPTDDPTDPGTTPTDPPTPTDDPFTDTPAPETTDPGDVDHPETEVPTDDPVTDTPITEVPTEEPTMIPTHPECWNPGETWIGIDEEDGGIWPTQCPTDEPTAKPKDIDTLPVTGAGAATWFTSAVLVGAGIIALAFSRRKTSNR